MKKIMKWALLAAALMVTLMAQAGTATGSMTISGTSVASCSPIAETRNMGNVGFDTAKAIFGQLTFVYPTIVNVSCTSGTVTYTLYSSDQLEVPVTIGTTDAGTVGMYHPEPGSTVQATVGAPISGTGTGVKNVQFYFHGSGIGGCSKPGCGKLGALDPVVIPLTVAF